MAEHAGVSCHQVTQIWKAADLKPHRIRNFKISHDPHFAEKVIDVVGLYMDPPDNALVLSVDEKTQIQALDRTQPMLQLKPGQIERRTHDYKRHGTASLYAAFDVATGEVMGRITKRHRAQEFLAFLRQIDQAVDPDLDIHLILELTKPRRFEVGWRAENARTLLLPAPPGSTPWRPGSLSWSVVPSTATPSPAFKICDRRSEDTCESTINTWPSPSSGAPPPIRSWQRSKKPENQSVNVNVGHLSDSTLVPK